MRWWKHWWKWRYMTLFFVTVFKTPSVFTCLHWKRCVFRRSTVFISVFGSSSVDTRKCIKAFAFLCENALVFDTSICWRLQRSQFGDSPTFNYYFCLYDLHTSFCIFKIAQCIFRQAMPESPPMKRPQNNRWRGRKFLLTEQKSISYGKSLFLFIFDIMLRFFFEGISSGFEL